MASLHPTDHSQADLLYDGVTSLMSRMRKVLRSGATRANTDEISREFGCANTWSLQAAAGRSSVLAHRLEQLTCGPSSGEEKGKKCFCQTEMTAARPLLHRGELFEG